MSLSISQIINKFLSVKIIGKNGNEANVTNEGKLETTTSVDVNIDSVTATDVTIRDAANPDRKLSISPDGAVNVTLATSLSKEYDSVDMGKMSKGGAVTAINAVSVNTVSNQIDSHGYNAVLLHVVITGTGSWKIDVQNATISNGTFIDAFDGNNQLTTGNLSTSRCILLRGITDFIKVTATKVTDGATCTVKVQPLNV